MTGVPDIPDPAFEAVVTRITTFLRAAPGGQEPDMDSFCEAVGQRGQRDAGWSLAILSNCDDDLLATTLERMPVPFDVTITAEQSGSYKPDPGHWRAFAKRTDGDRGRWVHAAQSWFHDIDTAAQLGLPSVWVDRLGSGEDASRATVRIEDLTGLPDAVERAAA